jgi:hypothetical protein
MDYVSMGGRRYACPFTDRPLTEDEESYLRQSIGELGIVVEVMTYDSPEYGPAIIQGRNRVRLGQELGQTIPVRHIGNISDTDAQAISHDVQASGRQLSPAQVEQARRDRRGRIVASRENGKSLRTIAAEEGVSHTTVKKALDRSGVNPVTPDAVLGADGKTYPSRADRFAEDEEPTDDELGEIEEEEDLSPREIAHREAQDGLDRCGACLAGLVEELDDLLAGVKGDTLRARAKRRGKPFPANGSARQWGPLVLLREVIGS